MLSEHLEKLVHFIGVVESGSIRKYSIRQQLSQPAISKCLQNLESALEVTLFARGRDGITLSQSGQELFQWADRVLTESKQLEDSIRKRSNLRLRGQLKMGTYQSIAIYFVPKFFKFIQKEQNDLHLEFFSAPSSKLITMLKNGLVDFIVSVDPPKSSEIYSLSLFEDRYSLYRAKNSKLSLKNSAIFTLPTATDSKGTSLYTYLKKIRLDHQIVSCGDFEAVKAMLECDAGLALLPERVASRLLASEKIEELRQPRELNHFGSHWITFSCKRHRAADESLVWIANQLELLLRSEL